VPIKKEDIEVLAYRLYKLNESYEHNCWRLAELYETIKKNTTNGHEIQALESENIVFFLKNDRLLEPNHDEIAKTAEMIYHDSPEKSRLHWFIAEKTLLLEEIKNALGKKEK
jgi:hypothetical protein